MRNILSTVTRRYPRLDVWHSKRTQTSTFLSGLALLGERYCKPASQSASKLKEALYSRPTNECERQIAYLTRQPLAEVRVLLAKNRFHNICTESRRSTPGDSHKIGRYAAAIQIPQRRELIELLREDTRSRIIVSFHFGDFIFGPALVSSFAAKSRKNFVLSLNANPPSCFENLEKAFGSLAPGPASELLYAQTSSVELARRLRGGNTTLLLFCDLPSGLMETAELEFLGRRARFSLGPALLALANSVPLLPLITYFDQGSNYVWLGRQIEPRLLKPETLREGAARLTQELLRFFEPVFSKYPEQWRFLPLLPSYFSFPDQS